MSNQKSKFTFMKSIKFEQEICNIKYDLELSNKNGQLEIKDKYEYGLGRLKTGFETTSKQDSIKIKPNCKYNEIP